MSQLVLNAAERQVNKSTENPQRATEMLRMTVARIRHAVRRGGRSPLSNTAGSVPPEAEQHALVLTADAMTASTPNLGQVVVTPMGGTGGPWKDLVAQAKKWLADVLAGEFAPTYPTDPMQQGDGTELVPDGQAYQSGSFILTGLRVGTLYFYEAGPNEASLVCGATTLNDSGQFYALATTATITAAEGDDIVFVTASVQKGTDAVNKTTGGQVVGEVDMSTDGPSNLFPT